MVKFAELLHSTLNVEMELHRQYAERFGVTREELEQTGPPPTTVAYTKYMLDAALKWLISRGGSCFTPLHVELSGDRSCFREGSWCFGSSAVPGVDFDVWL